MPIRRFSAWGVGAVLLGLATLSLPACEKQVSGRPQPRAEAVPVLAEPVVREDVPVTMRAIGTVEAYRTVAVGSRVTGTLVRVHFREGAEVRRDDILFTVDPRPYEIALRAAEADLAQVTARARTAALDAERSRSLFGQSLISRQEHDRLAAAAAVESAAVLSRKADLETARLNLDYCAIRSPISGRTSNLLVHEGNLVRSNVAEPLVVINQVEPIYVSFSIPERRLPEVMRRMRESGPLPVEARPSEAEGGPAMGKLAFVNNAVDPESGTILMKAEFANADGSLWPGEFVEVTLFLTRRFGAVVVPTVAVQSGQQGDYCIVVNSDQTTEIRPVVISTRLDGKAIVESGLEPGETVVTDGHLRIAPGGKVAIRSGLGSGALEVPPAGATSR